jgi:hypothetical protein
LSSEYYSFVYEIYMEADPYNNIHSRTLVSLALAHHWHPSTTVF